MRIYVDGSFRNGKIGWGFIAVKNNCFIYSNNGVLTRPEYLEGRQIAGECAAVVNALRWCEALKFGPVDFYFDYIGVRYWVADIWGEKPWKTNTTYTKTYREFCLKRKNLIRDMVKVKAHSGDYWNEKVDELAAELL